MLEDEIDSTSDLMESENICKVVQMALRGLQSHVSVLAFAIVLDVGAIRVEQLTQLGLIELKLCLVETQSTLSGHNILLQ